MYVCMPRACCVIEVHENGSPETSVPVLTHLIAAEKQNWVFCKSRMFPLLLSYLTSNTL